MKGRSEEIHELSGLKHHPQYPSEVSLVEGFAEYSSKPEFAMVGKYWIIGIAAGCNHLGRGVADEQLLYSFAPTHATGNRQVHDNDRKTVSGCLGGGQWPGPLSGATEISNQA